MHSSRAVLITRQLPFFTKKVFRRGVLLIRREALLLPILVKNITCARAGKGIAGGYSEGEPPLPIPNREVKPLSADGTAPEGVGE